MDRKNIENIVKKVLEKLETEQKTAKTEELGLGVCSNMEIAIEKASSAQKHYEKYSLNQREKLINHLRRELTNFVEEISEMTVNETGMGKVKDKIKTNLLAIEKTPGIEDLSTQAFTGDNGLTLIELSAFGVVGSVTPVTNPTETIINNTISALVAGNSIVFSPHPKALKVSKYLVRVINEIIEDLKDYPKNLVTISKTSGKNDIEELFNHVDVDLLVVTGGTEIVNKALRSGKKVIGAESGNPPVIVDESANITKAAKDIVSGASFDNNLLCVSEKSVLVIDDVTDYLTFCMQKEGAIQIENTSDIEKLQNCILKDGKPNENYVGKSPAVILKDAGIQFEGNPKLIIVETDILHPFVQEELLMPVVPVVRQKDFDTALKNAIQVEGKRNNTAIIHSQNVSRLSEAAKKIKTTIFVKNAPSYVGLGFEGEGYVGFTVAGKTGEGIVSAKDFARRRRCVLSGSFSIR